jgi:hypothetical protein
MTMAEGDVDDPKNYGSLVLNNLMKRPGYAPYCMGMKAVEGGYVETECSMPRMKWDGEQFSCSCGGRTQLTDDFLSGYNARWSSFTELPG